MSSNRISAYLSPRESEGVAQELNTGTASVLVVEDWIPTSQSTLFERGTDEIETPQRGVAEFERVAAEQ